MNKKLIAVAVAAAVSMPAIAMAEMADEDIKVYGITQVEVANTDPQASGQDAAVGVVDNAMGRLGVKATEDLGGGLKGLAMAEFKLDTADGNSDTACKNDTCSSTTGVALTARELLVGLKGGFGQVELGRLKPAYKYAGGVKYDPFVATTLQARGNGGMVGAAGAGKAFGQNSFISKHIGYNSPKLGPVSIRVTYGPSEDDSSYTASAKAGFKMGEVFVALADEGDLEKTADPNTTKEYSAWKLGGQVRLAGGAHKISLQYEATEVKTGTTTVNPTFIFAGYQGTFGKSTFVAQFGANDADVDNKDVSYLAIGAIYKFSKKTRVFGGYRNTDADDDSGESVISIGMRKDFK